MLSAAPPGKCTPIIHAGMIDRGVWWEAVEARPDD
jgi:hypothetical protein